MLRQPQWRLGGCHIYLGMLLGLGGCNFGLCVLFGLRLGLEARHISLCIQTSLAGATSASAGSITCVRVSEATLCSELCTGGRPVGCSRELLIYSLNIVSRCNYIIYILNFIFLSRDLFVCLYCLSCHDNKMVML